MAVYRIQNTLKIFLFLGLRPGHFLSISNSIVRRLGLQKSLFSHGKYCKNRCFMEIAFKELRDRFLMFFPVSVSRRVLF